MTIQDVLRKLQEDDCLSFPYGGSIRDQFLGKSLDMETNCDANKVIDSCNNAWGASNCITYNNRIVHIGNTTKATEEMAEVLDISNWDETFFGSGDKLEYTTNSIAYFADDLNIIIDITGQGVNDTCNKNIRIPVREDDREKWASRSKVYRFWKLRIKEYKAIDTSTQSFIVLYAKRSIMNDTEYFKSYYCNTTLSGKWINSACMIPKELCEDAKCSKRKYDSAFKEDLGDFWADTARPLIDDLESDSCYFESTQVPTTNRASTTNQGSGNEESSGYLPTTAYSLVLCGLILTIILTVHF